MSQYTTQTQCARATRRAIRECRARASARVYTGVRTLSLRKGFKGLVDFYFYLSDNGYVVRIFITFFIYNNYLHLHFPLIKLYMFFGLSRELNLDHITIFYFFLVSMLILQLFTYICFHVSSLLSGMKENLVSRCFPLFQQY